MRLLVAEDQSMLRDALCQLLLLQEDVEDVLQAGDGQEAIRLLETHPVDIAILDIEMPIKTGLEVLEWAKSQQPQLKVVIVTTFKRPGYFERAQMCIRDSIAVVAGDGLADIFKAQGVDYIISGGQTMNPVSYTHLQPNMLVIRTEKPAGQGIKNKLAQFCDVAPEAVIESLDVEHLYQIPLNLQAQNMDQIVCDHLKLDVPAADMTEWSAMVDKVMNLKKQVKISLVGKYVELQDAYISVVEALKHSGYANDAEVKINWVNANDVTADNVAELLGDADGIIVPGGFGQRGTEGKIQAIKYAREQDVPMLGVCLGMQLTCIEFARHVLGLEGANSSELDPETKYPIIDIMRDQINVEDMGGTLRLGLYPSKLKRGSKAAAAYDNQEVVQRRHRHRYEFNNAFREQFEAAGFVFSGVSPDNRLVEIVEIPENKFFVACQYHPELSSRPNRPEGLYTAFITAAVENHDSK